MHGNGGTSTTIRVGGLDTYRTTRSTMLGFIPVGFQMIAGMAPCKRFLDEVGTGLRQADPAARRGERRLGMFSGWTMFIGMLVAMSVIRVRAGGGFWLGLEVLGPDGFGPVWVGTPIICSMAWSITLAGSRPAGAAHRVRRGGRRAAAPRSSGVLSRASGAADGPCSVHSRPSWSWWGHA